MRRHHFAAQEDDLSGGSWEWWALPRILCLYYDDDEGGALWWELMTLPALGSSEPVRATLILASDVEAERVCAWLSGKGDLPAWSGRQDRPPVQPRRKK